MLSEDTLVERTLNDCSEGVEPEFKPSCRLDPKYAEKGFSLSSFAGHSTMLWHEDELVFIFGSTIPAEPVMVSKICECYLKHYGQGLE